MTEPISEIVVPGSTSNLGPAFDTLSVALDVHLRVRVVAVDREEPDTLVMSFDGRPPAGENRIETAFHHARGSIGVPARGLTVRVSSDIPMAAGLGSSAAAAVAGLRLYELASGTSTSTDDLLAMASALEGHPDNAAAALLGGITLSCEGNGGRIIARAWEWPSAIRFVIATPDLGLLTEHARGVLPATIPLRDAVANLQRALLFIRALETGRYDDIREALRDRWHQPARTSMVPGLSEALAIDHPAVLGVCLSGAGPSVLALAAPNRSREAAAVLGALYQRLRVPHTIRDLAAHPSATARPPAAVTQEEKTA